MDKIKEKIQSLCPDVMELKFGCAFEDFTDRWVILSLIDESFLTACLHESKTMYRTKDMINRSASIEILGSPITLAVVLRAIEKYKDDLGVEGEGSFVGVMEGGAFIQQDAETSEVTFDGAQWNLEHDSYAQQSEECKQFIGSLLGVNN